MYIAWTAIKTTKDSGYVEPQSPMHLCVLRAAMRFQVEQPARCFVLVFFDMVQLISFFYLMNQAFSTSDLKDRNSLPCPLTSSKRLQVMTSVLEITSQALVIC